MNPRLLLRFLLPSAPLALIAQQSARHTAIGDELSCPRCVIQVSSSFVLRASSAGAGTIWTLPNAVRIDGRARIWVLQPNEPAILFDSKGKFLRSVGEKGKGPGEYGAPVEVIAFHRDSVALVDALNLRTSILDADLVPRRFVSTPWIPKPLVVAEWPSRLVGRAVARTPRSAGYPLHLLSMAGRELSVAKSFGADSGTLLPGSLPSALALARCDSKTFWAAELSRYQLTEWTYDGRAIRVLDRRPDWFRGDGGQGLGNPREPPPARIADTRCADDGLLWVLINTPKASWRNAWPSRGQAREVRSAEIRFSQLFETIIEVVDPRSAQVVARQRTSEYLFGLLAGNRAAAFRNEADGTPSVAILQLTLRRK